MNDLAPVKSAPGQLRELALFAGAGGGLLSSRILGWRTVCAVENNEYAASVLVARQNDGTLPPFPIWADDIRGFDGRPWRGSIDVVSGGFPCQDISTANPSGGVLTESAPDFGEKWHGSFAKFSQDTSLWKIPQISLLEDSGEFLETWPKWGSMRNGECWERSTLEPPITENGYGYLPTPAASDWKGEFTMETVKRRMVTRSGVRLSEELCRRAGKVVKPLPEFWEWMMGWPVGMTSLDPLTGSKELKPQETAKSPPAQLSPGVPLCRERRRISKAKSPTVAKNEGNDAPLCSPATASA